MPADTTHGMAGRRKRLNRAEKRDVTRARLLAAGRKIFGRSGFHAASLEEIADEAGFSKGALYYNFGDKAGLFLALLDERLEERVDTISAAFEGAGSWQEGVREGARRFIASLDENREWQLLYFEFWAHAARDPVLRPRLAASLEAMRAGVAAVLEQRAHELGIRAEEAERLAIAVNALANGIMLEWHARPGTIPEDLFGETVVRLFGVRRAGSSRASLSRRARS
jgi:AcrR family transcriptional regulator